MPGRVKSHGLLFTMSLISNKDIVNLFYTRAGPTDKIWKHQCSTSRTEIDTNFSNLMQRLERKPPAELRTPRNKFTPGQKNYLGKLLYSPKVIYIHGWLRYVIHCLHPFAVVQDKDMQTRIRYKRVSLNTSKPYTSVLTSFVVEYISN